MIGLLTGVSMSYKPITISNKIFFITWSAMGYVFSQFYLASLAKNLLTGGTFRIENVADLISSNLKLVADLELSGVYGSDGINSQYEYDNIIKTRLEYKSKAEIGTIKENLLAGKMKDTAILMMQNFSSAKLDLGDCAHQMREISASYPLALATWKGMPVLAAVDKAMMILVESGLVTHWSNKFSHAENIERKNSLEKNVGLNDLFPAFLLAFFGYLLAFTAFIMEIVLNKYFFGRRSSLK